MATSYDKYLKKLRTKIGQDPYMQQARRTAFATMPKQATFEQYASRTGAPVGVVAQQELGSQAVRQKSLTGVVERAGAKDIERKERIGEQIADIEFKRDEFEKQKKDKFGDTLLQVGGAVIGGAIGGLPGASLGASAGQILGGFTGDNSEDIAIGMGNAIQTFSQISTTKSNKELGEKASILSDKFQYMNRDQRQMILQQLQMGVPINSILERFAV
jgi:hypothetical protein